MDKKPEQSELPTLKKMGEHHAPARDANSRLKNPGDVSSSYEEYLFGRNLFAGKVEKPGWSDSTQGRVLIRAISRGIFGAAAFAWGGRYASGALRGYSYDKTPANVLQWIAKGFDYTFGKPISFIARGAAPKALKDVWAKDVVTFRTKGYYHDIPGLEHGRSLGAEMVAITFDFAAMSVGDAAARNMIQAIDPNIKHRWVLDKNGKPAEYGKGRFDLGKWMESLGRSTWRILSKNAGEDWAVALPYVYQMKWQREALAKWTIGDKKTGKLTKPFDGFKLASDHHTNGGNDKLRTRKSWWPNRVKGDIVGNYNDAGAIDLHFRFVGYNVYTQMFREMYDTVGYNLNKWKDNGFQLDLKLPENPVQWAVDSVGGSARYLMKNFIKANIYMQPAVIPFWMMRTPQSMWRSPTVLHADHVTPAGKPKAYGYLTIDRVSQNEWQRFNNPIMLPAAKGRHLHEGLTLKNGKPWDGKTIWSGDKKLDPISANRIINRDVFSVRQHKGWFRPLGDFSLGRFSFNRGTNAVDFVDKAITPNSTLGKFLGGDPTDPRYVANRETFVRQFVDASLSYTPYFIAKQEFGLRVDDKPSDGHSLGRMDKAIYRFLDNMFTFNIGGMGQSLGDVGSLIGRANQEPHKYRENPKDSALPNAPATTVQSTTVQHNRRKDDLAHPDRQWAESVTGRKLEGQYIPPTNTLN